MEAAGRPTLLPALHNGALIGRGFAVKNAVAAKSRSMRNDPAFPLKGKSEWPDFRRRYCASRFNGVLQPISCKTAVYHFTLRCQGAANPNGGTFASVIGKLANRRSVELYIREG